MKHTDRPLPSGALASMLEQEAEALRNSDYFRYLSPVQEAVTGKEVVSSSAGNAGFLLVFSDGTWVSAYVAGARLAYEYGSGEPPASARAHCTSPEAGDASAPLAYNCPYADESCDIAAQVSRAHGQVVEGLAFGADCFNFCFPGGMELDTALVKDPKGHLALRVFWEQW